MVASAITRVVEKCQRLGYVDDVAFAASQARSQRRQGKSTMAIRHRLRRHGLDDAAIAKVHYADTDEATDERRPGPFLRRAAAYGIARTGRVFHVDLPRCPRQRQH